MQGNIFRLPMSDIGSSLIIGTVCAVVYLYLLWQTVRLLPAVTHRGLFLFISVGLRIFLLLTVMILFAGESAGRFILIFCGFIIFRLIILRFTRLGTCNREQDMQMTKLFGGKR